MLKKSIYDTIKQGFRNGIYKSIRLIRINEEGKRETVLPFSKMGELKYSFDRLDHIKLQIDKKLPPGKYLIECNTGHGISNLKDSFEVIIKEPLLISEGNIIENKLQENIIDKTEDQEQMHNIDFEDYLQLIKECEKLKAQNALLLTQLEMTNKMQGVNNLSDSEPKTITEKVFKSLDDNLPMVLNIFDKFITQRDKQLELKEKELNIKSGHRTMSKKTKVNPDKVVKELEALYDKDENLFNKALDELEDKDPNLYQYCCNALGIEDNEEMEIETDSEE